MFKPVIDDEPDSRHCLLKGFIPASKHEQYMSSKNPWLRIRVEASTPGVNQGKPYVTSRNFPLLLQTMEVVKKPPFPLEGWSRETPVRFTGWIALGDMVHMVHGTHYRSGNIGGLVDIEPPLPVITYSLRQRHEEIEEANASSTAHQRQSTTVLSNNDFAGSI